MNYLLTIIFPIVISLCLVFSFLSSYVEMAIASANPLILKSWSKNVSASKRKKAVKVLSLQKKSNETFSAIVIFNNIVNILNSTIATIWFNELLGSQIGPLVSFLTMTFLVICVGELIPKFLARKSPEKACMKLTWFISILMIVLKPITIPLSKLTNETEKLILSSKQELGIALLESKKNNITTSYEDTLLRQALNLSSIKVEDIMSESILYVDKDISQNDLNKFLLKNKKTRIIVKENDHVIGIFNVTSYLYDFLNSKTSKFNISNWISQAIELEEGTYLNEALSILQSKRQKLGIVIDHHDELIGVITTEDIVEELVGEIFDENDLLTKPITLTHNNTLIVKRNVKVIDVLKTHFPKLVKKLETQNITMEKWAKEILNLEELPDKGSFVFENLIIWIRKIQDSSNEIIFEIDLV